MNSLSVASRVSLGVFVVMVVIMVILMIIRAIMKAQMNTLGYHNTVAPFMLAKLLALVSFVVFIVTYLI